MVNTAWRMACNLVGNVACYNACCNACYNSCLVAMLLEQFVWLRLNGPVEGVRHLDLTTSRVKSAKTDPFHWSCFPLQL